MKNRVNIIGSTTRITKELKVKQNKTNQRKTATVVSKVPKMYNKKKQERNSLPTSSPETFFNERVWFFLMRGLHKKTELVVFCFSYSISLGKSFS